MYRDEVIARCDKHAQFLLAHFPKELAFEPSGLTWKDTSFYKWMLDRHPVSQTISVPVAPVLPLTMCRTYKRDL